MGLKESGLRGSLRSVSTGVSAIPDDALAQFVANDDPQSSGSISTIPDQLADFDLDGNAEIVTDELNGNDVYRLTRSDFVQNTSLSDKNQPNAYFMVVKVETSDSNDVIVDGAGSTDANTHQLFKNDDPDEYSLQGDIQGGSVSNWDIITAIFDTDNSVLRKNGTEVASGAIADEILSGITVGASRDGENGSTMDFAEFIPTSSRPSSQTIGQQEQRLSDQYGLPLD